jgi:hypothetical protein
MGEVRFSKYQQLRPFGYYVCKRLVQKNLPQLSGFKLLLLPDVGLCQSFDNFLFGVILTHMVD